jgi:serine/threonine protein kinase
VLDFGLAKLAPVGSGGGESTQLGVNTETGLVVGTVAYMSPEQARGQPVDARTDIWSLGVMLYEMVAGRGPFAAPSGSDVLAAILQNEPLPLIRFEPDAPTELQRISTKTLRKDRSQRYQTVQDLLLDLQALREDSQFHARSGSAQTHLGPTPQKPRATKDTPRVGWPRRRFFAGAATLIVAAVALGSWWWLRASSPPVVVNTSSVRRDLGQRLLFALYTDGRTDEHTPAATARNSISRMHDRSSCNPAPESKHSRPATLAARFYVCSKSACEFVRAARRALAIGLPPSRAGALVCLPCRCSSRYECGDT